MSEILQNEVSRWREGLDRLGRALLRSGPDEVCCEDLTPRQTSVLRLLAGHEGSRLSDVAAVVGVSPSAMTRLLERLEERGLVQRVRGLADDGRAATIRVTASGREACARIDCLAEERVRVIMAAVPAEARQHAPAVLQALSVALETCCTPAEKAADSKNRDHLYSIEAQSNQVQSDQVQSDDGKETL